jgi:hypothetical protein
MANIVNAEKMARRVLALDPQHPGAIHVVVHVMEMQGRAREGLAFLRRPRRHGSKAPDFQFISRGIARCSSSIRTIRTQHLRLTTRRLRTAPFRHV